MSPVKWVEDMLVDVSMDPVKYAIRVWLVLAVAIFLLLVVRNAFPAERESVSIKCNNGVCTIPQDQLMTLMRLLRIGCDKAVAI